MAKESTNRREHGVRELRPGRGGPHAEREVGQTTQSDPRDRVDPEERAAAPEMPERLRRVVHAGPVRRLRIPQLEPEAPVVRFLTARSRAARRRDPGTALQWPRQASRARGALAPAAPARARAGRPAFPRRPIRPSRAAGPSSLPEMREVLRERHLGALLDERGSDLETVVRVHASNAGPRDRWPRVEWQARGVREQMTERRARGPAGSSRSTRPSSAATSMATAVASFVTEAQANRRPTSPCVASTVPVTPTATCRHGQPSTWRRASTNGETSEHGTPVDHLRGRVRGARRLLAGRAGRRPRVGLGHGADHAGRRRSAADAYEQARICLAIIERALVEAGASLDDVVRTRIYLTDAVYIDEVGRAHGEAFARARLRRPASSPRCSIRAGSSKSRPKR